MDIGTWRLLFDASPSELGDLLVFTRARDAQITSRALAGEVVEIPIVLEGWPDAGEIEIREAEEDPPPAAGDGARWRGRGLRPVRASGRRESAPRHRGPCRYR
jgi:hypothetical protein